MSPRDLPLWARGAAGALLIFAAWWLVSTAAIRATVGPSVALVSLGVVAAFILRGMHVPLDLWPRGPWRGVMPPGGVLATGLGFAAVIVLMRPPELSPLLRLLDGGVYVLVPAGAVAWGVALALVRQRSYLPWYGGAAAAALAPLVLSLVWGGGDPATPVSGVAWAASLRTLVFAATVGAAAGLVTEELALRRLLIGQPADAGLAVVVLAGVVAAAWHAVVGTALHGGGLPPVWVSVAAGSFAAGALYVLSGSLLVSALCNALVFGGAMALEVARPALQPAVTLVPQVAVALLLLGLVARRNGLLRGLTANRETHALSD